jgi:hypothetical protein
MADVKTRAVVRLRCELTARARFSPTTGRDLEAWLDEIRAYGAVQKVEALDRDIPITGDHARLRADEVLYEVLAVGDFDADDLTMAEWVNEIDASSYTMSIEALSIVPILPELGTDDAVEAAAAVYYPGWETQPESETKRASRERIRAMLNAAARASARPAVPA